MKLEMKPDAGIPVSIVAETYLKAIEGTANGQVLLPG
jgi:hypothetical protein